MLSTVNYQHLSDYITFKNVSIQEVHHILSSMMMNVQCVILILITIIIMIIVIVIMN